MAAGWFERARRLLDPLPPGRRPRLARVPRGLRPPPRGGGRSRPRPSPPKRLTSAAASACRTWRCSGWRSRARRWSPAHASARGCGAWTRRPPIALEERAEIPISGAWVCCFLVSACLEVYDFERAFAWSDRIAAFAQRYGSRWMLAFCRAEYGAVHRWRGRWTEAEALLEAAIVDFAHSRPAWAPGPLTGLAELRRRQGRTTEALALLDRAGATDAPVPRPDRARPRRHARRRRARRSPAAADTRRAPARARAGARAGRTRRAPRAASPFAAPAATELRELAELAGTGAAEGDRRPRRRASPAATGHCSRTRSTASRGAPYEAAQARLDLARVLERDGRDRAAAKEREAANRVLRELGARAVRRCPS